MRPRIVAVTLELHIGSAAELAEKALGHDDRRERQVDTSFGRTDVVSVGRDDAPPLVLLHGSGGCAAMLADHAAWFAAREFTVHVPDVPELRLR
jgi:pimeloyl-ACP methyl ester carboxylesterase